MSIRYVATVLDKLTGLTATDTLVLIALADYASDDTRQCWPSIARIAARARCDRRTVQRRLRSLEARGWIEAAKGGHQYGVGTASQYRLKFDHDGHIVPDVEVRLEVGGRQRAALPVDKLSTRAALTTPKGGTDDTQGRHSAAPSVIDPSLIQERGAKSAAIKTPPVDKSARVRAAAALSDEELEEIARSGKLTAEQEVEREHRRRMRPRRSGQ